MIKSADQRWQTVQDLRDELRWIADGMSQVGTVGSAVVTRQPSGWRNVLVTAASLIIGGAAMGGAVWVATRPTPPRVVRTQITTAGAAFTARNILVALWPSSLMLMATAGVEGTPYAYNVIATAILVNVLLYSIVGTGIWAIAKVLSTLRRKL